MELCRSGKLNLPKNLVGKARDLVKLLLVDDPEQRLSIQQIKEHSFFKGTNWTNMQHRKMKPPFVPDRLRLNQIALGGFDSNINLDLSIDDDNDNTREYEGSQNGNIR